MSFNLGDSGVVSGMIALGNESPAFDSWCAAGNSRSPNFLQRRGGEEETEIIHYNQVCQKEKTQLWARTILSLKPPLRQSKSTYGHGTAKKNSQKLVKLQKQYNMKSFSNPDDLAMEEIISSVEMSLRFGCRTTQGCGSRCRTTQRCQDQRLACSIGAFIIFKSPLFFLSNSFIEI